MLQRLVVILPVILILISPVAAEEKERLKIGEPAPEFTLKDADDKEYSSKILLNKEARNKKVMILAMGDRKVQGEANKWAVELDKTYGKKKEVVLLMIADLRDLPFFVTEGMVKWGTKREKLPVPILLDWKGKISKMYKTQKGKPDLFVVDGDGKISYHYVGLYSDEVIKKMQATVQVILEKQKSVPDEKAGHQDTKAQKHEGD